MSRQNWLARLRDRFLGPASPRMRRRRVAASPIAAQILHLEPRTLLAAPTLVKDINPATTNPSSSASNVTQVGTKLFYTASSPASGVELAVSDGTAAGTSIVADFAVSSTIGNLTNVNGTLYFTANDGTNGTEL